MMTAAGLLDRLSRKAFGDHPQIEHGWIRITEAMGGINWSVTASSTVPEALAALWNAERDRLEDSTPRVDWSEVTSRRGLVRELVMYLD